MPTKLIITAALLALVSTGCVSSYRTPKLELPTAETEAPLPLNAWWQSFGDPTLNSLVEEALAHNADVLTAMQSVEIAKSNLSQARWALLPDVNAQFTATRQNSSNYTALPGQTGTLNFYQGGFNASYEVDLWGRAWNTKSAIAARLLASRYARETTRSSVAAQTAKSYFTLLALDAQMSLLKQTQETRQQALSLQQVRQQAGVSGDYEVQLDQAELATIAARLPTVIAAREQAEGALALLLGRSPKEVAEGHANITTTLDGLANVAEIPVGLPADLLTRRPDVRQAEANLVAAHASLQEVKGRYFPSISLTGFFGGESFTLGTLLDTAARSWNIAGAVTQSITGLGTTRAQVRGAQAQREQAEIAYAQAARAAYADTRTTLASHRGALEALNATRQRRDNLVKLKSITELRYDRGAASYLDTLNIERDRLSAEDDYVQALQNRLDAMVNVYQALGGGWNPDELLRQ